MENFFSRISVHNRNMKHARAIEFNYTIRFNLDSMWLKQEYKSWQQSAPIK